MALKIALSGFLTLMVAMGIGRFAFTPQVPLMIAEHQLTLTSVGIVAALNYFGYLVGAFDAMRAKSGITLRLWGGVWGTVILTLWSAIMGDVWGHGLIRFLAGWASGWAMVLVAAWTNESLAHYGKPALSAAVFAGPGAGILISGMLAIGVQGMALNAAQAWLLYGSVALVVIVAVSRHLPRGGISIRQAVTTIEPLVLTRPLKRLVWSYSLAGFGYILPATFLSQMAAERFPGSLFAQLVWPLFGGAAVLGIVIGITTRHLLTTHQRLALMLWAQAIGIVCAVSFSNLSGLIIASLLVGGGFLAVVQLSLQYGRELAPLHVRYLAGLLTTGYAIGQLVGPLVSSLSTMLTHQLEPSLYIGMLALVAAGALVWKA